MNSGRAVHAIWSVLFYLFVFVTLISWGVYAAVYKGDPIIFIPGTAGVWSEEQYLTLRKESLLIKAADGTAGNYTTMVDNGRWIVEPFGGLYNDFFETLRQRGLVREKDYFIFGYDTITTPIEDNARRLSDYVEYVRRLTGKSKVRIIAHSQGGLVARAYIQFETDPARAGSVSELVMVATPNRGTLLTYQMIEGGNCHTYQSYLSVQAPFELLIATIVRGSFITGYDEEVRERLNSRDADGRYVYMPIWQMLPTFPYLIDASGMRNDTESQEAYPINPLLFKLNGESVARLKSVKVTAVISIGTPIADSFFVSAPNPADVAWPHGKILSMGYGSGDGICLLKSIDLSDELRGSNYRLVYTRDAQGRIVSVDHNSYFTSKNLSTWISFLNLPPKGAVSIPR